MNSPLDLLKQSTNPEIQKLVREHEANEQQARQELLEKQDKEQKERRIRQALDKLKNENW